MENKNIVDFIKSLSSLCKDNNYKIKAKSNSIYIVDNQNNKEYEAIIR